MSTSRQERRRSDRRQNSGEPLHRRVSGGQVSGQAVGRQVVGRQISRRRFATSAARWWAAAAGLVGLPILSELRAEAQDAHPLRLLLVFNPNGTLQDHFWPTPGATEQDFEFNTITQPLEPFREHLLFLKGLNIGVAETGPGGPHQKGVGGVFTNAELQNGTFMDGDGSRAGWANGVSVDQAIAQRVGQGDLLSSLELGVRAMKSEVRTRISYAGPASPMPPINSPLAAYQRLFSGFGFITAEQRATRRSVVDALKGQYAELTPHLSVVDQRKLDQHYELVRGIERRLDVAIDPSTCARPASPADLAEDDEETMPEIIGLQSELMALAFGCGLTRVGSLQISSAINDIRYPWLDSLRLGHTLSHAGPSNLEAEDEMLRRYTWHSEQIADLLGKLKEIPEGDGSLLDNTIVVWGNELGTGNTHRHQDIPFVVAGGKSAGWQLGRFLDFKGIAHSGLLVSLLNAFGFDDAQFGHPDFSNGALSGLEG